MTWIKVVPPDEASPALREAIERQRATYPPEYGDCIAGLPCAETDGIVAAHSLIPEALEHVFATFAACMSPALPLSRRQHEIIATTVSRANRTRYCSVSHAEFLRRVG